MLKKIGVKLISSMLEILFTNIYIYIKGRIKLTFMVLDGNRSLPKGSVRVYLLESGVFVHLQSYLWSLKRTGNGTPGANENAYYQDVNLKILFCSSSNTNLYQNGDN